MPGLKVVGILNFQIESFQITNYKSSTSSPIPIPCHRDQKALKKSSSPDLETLKIPLFFSGKFSAFFRSGSGLIPESFRKRPEKTENFPEKSVILSFRVRLWLA